MNKMPKNIIIAKAKTRPRIEQAIMPPPNVIIAKAKNRKRTTEKSFTALRCIPRLLADRDFSYKKSRVNDDAQSLIAAKDAVADVLDSIPNRDSDVGTKVTFKREMLDNVQVIGQFDRKFIICSIQYSKDGRQDKLIAAFDQHAVHERVRLEHLYKEQGLTKSSTIPDSLKAALASMACKTAVRFGDKLSKGKCEQLIEALRTCDQPFQCAHGRPSVAPLLKLPDDITV